MTAPSVLIERAEQRGYNKGYAAGQRRADREDAQANSVAAHNKLWNAAFLAALPAALTVDDWKRDGEAINTLIDRVRLASDTADKAAEYFKDETTA